MNEFYSLIDFAIPNSLGDRAQFDREYGKPIIKGRDLDATDKEIEVHRIAGPNTS